MSRRRDTVGLLEAIYAIEQEELPWFDGVVKAVRPLLDEGQGVFGHIFDARTYPIRLWGMRAEGTPISPIQIERAIFSADERYAEHMWRRRSCVLASEVPTFNEQPGPRKYLYPKRIADGLVINAYDPAGFGCFLGAFRPKVEKLHAKERGRWLRIAAHLAAAYRLRRKLDAGRSGETAPIEAVFTPAGKVEHLETNVISSRAVLKDAVVAIDRARSAKARAWDPSRTLGQWEALVKARWTLLDSFESDGKRYVVARSNEPHDPPIEELTPRERQVLAYAAMSNTDKLTAYELGLAPSTVRVLMARAIRRLGVRSRAEAVAAFQRLRRS